MKFHASIHKRRIKHNFQKTYRHFKINTFQVDLSFSTYLPILSSQRKPSHSKHLMSLTQHDFLIAVVLALLSFDVQLGGPLRNILSNRYQRFVFWFLLKRLNHGLINFLHKSPIIIFSRGRG